MKFNKESKDEIEAFVSIMKTVTLAREELQGNYDFSNTLLQNKKRMPGNRAVFLRATGKI